MQCSCGFPEAVPLASTDAKRADSRENGQKRKIPYGNDAPRARERTLSMPFWPRPRSLETRKQRGFPHSHRDDCCCDPLELKPEPRMNTGDVTDSCTEPKKLAGRRVNLAVTRPNLSAILQEQLILLIRLW